MIVAHGAIFTAVRTVLSDYKMVLAKLITGALPRQDFLKTYDFTIPDENWFPVKEDVDGEVVMISKDVADIIRKHVSAVCEET